MDDKYTGKLCFFYGTLKDNQDERLSFVGEDTVSGFAMFNNGYPTCVPSENKESKIHGEVYRVVDPSVMIGLDRYEGYRENDPEKSLFIRVPITTDTGRDCMMYQYNSDPGPMLVPSGRYPFEETSR